MTRLVTYSYYTPWSFIHPGTEGFHRLEQWELDKVLGDPLRETTVSVTHIDQFPSRLDSSSAQEADGSGFLNRAIHTAGRST